MTKLLLSIHVLAAIVAIGPVTVAAGMFPSATRRALTDPADPRGTAVLHTLHRICRVYAALGVLVPVFGLATAGSLGVLGDAWLIVSIILTGAAAAMLILVVLPGQAAVLREDLPAQATALREDRPAADPQLTRPAGDRSAGHRPAVIADDRPEPLVTPPHSHHPGHPQQPAPPLAERGSRPATGPMASPDGATRTRRAAARLGVVTGVFNLVWAVVVVLMIVRPGSTTGA